VAIFSNGRAAARLAASVMAEASAIEHARLTMSTRRELLALPGVRIGAPGEAVIAEGGLTAATAAQAVRLLAGDAGVHGVLVLLAPSPESDLSAITQTLAEFVPRAGKPVITCYIGEARVRDLRHQLDELGTPAFRTPESAAHAFSILTARDYNQRLAQQILPTEPLGPAPDLPAAQALLARWREQNRCELSDAGCRQLLACFHFPQHYFAAVRPATHPHSVDIALRLERDEVLGPYLWFGAAEHAGRPSDRAIELPPLNHELARRLIQRSPLWREALADEICDGALAKLLDVLVCVSELACAMPALRSLSLSIQLADGSRLGLGRAQARLLAPAQMQPAWDGPGYRHMAIHPYPRELVQVCEAPEGQRWVMRPIRPEDAQPLQDFVRGLSAQSRYTRFVYLLRELTPSQLARYTQIDYDRELALVATTQTPNPAHRALPQECIIGLAHYFLLSDRRGAEFALVVHDGWQRRGLGTRLMQGLIDAARGQGLSYLEGQVLESNRAMRRLLARLGFQDQPLEGAASVRRLALDL
jgi:acetyltransferase